MSVNATIYPEAERSPRRQLQAGATVRDPTGQPVELVLVDLSETGFLISTEFQLQPGDIFSIGIPGIGTHRAIVRRAAERGYGCQFIAPVDRSALEAAGAETVVSWPYRGSSEEATSSDGRLPVGWRIIAIGSVALIIWSAIAAIGFVAIR